jgi:hypothetical protein
MAYTIDKYNGTTVAVVEDGTIDSTLDIKLIGKNYAGYGEVQNENFVHLLENFAGPAAPARPIAGQIWYNSTEKKLKFYDPVAVKWKTSGGAEVSATKPTGAAEGDLWFNPTTNQLYTWSLTGSDTGTPDFVLVGPQGLPGLGTTQLKSMVVTAEGGTTFPIIAAYVGGNIAYVISTSDSFNLDTNVNKAELISRFGLIKHGITLAYTDNDAGITDQTVPFVRRPSFHGTASAAIGLVNGNEVITADQLLLNSGTVVLTDLTKFSDSGFTVGDGTPPRLEVFIEGVNRVPVIRNNDSNTIEFRTTSGTPLKLLGANILPGTTNFTDIGSNSVKFKTVYATSFDGAGSALTSLNADNIASGTLNSARLSGEYNISITGAASSANTSVTATNADKLKLGSNYVDSSISIVPSSIVARTAVDEVISGTTITAGSVKANYFVGTATAALFADLAEKYLADQEYEIGTVVVVGGEAEVTACSLGSRAFGAVSGSPAYLMNIGLEGGTPIALKGRVPVKVIGAVKKGDRLIAADNGCCGASSMLLKNIPIKAGNFPDTFAIALESSTDEGVKLVEAIIL